MSEPGFNGIHSEMEQKPGVIQESSLGLYLRSRREETSKTAQHVAEALKISIRQVGWIESDSWSQFPAPAIARGFVRSYARFVGIDWNEIANRLPAELTTVSLIGDAKPALSTPFSDSSARFLNKSGSGNWRYLLGASILAVIAFVFLLFQYAEKNGYFHHNLNDVNASSSVSAESKISEVSSEKSSQVADTVVDTFRAQESRDQVASPVANFGEISGSGSAEGLKVNVESQVIVKAREDSWLQVKGFNGQVVYSKLLKSGSEEKFDIADGLNMKIGNAAGVDVFVKGSPYSFPVSKETNVANLVINK